MTDYPFQKDAVRLAKIMPAYIAVQAITLLLTFLDFPVYMLSYRAEQNLTVTPWLGAWAFLTIFGLATGLFLAAFKKWRAVFEDKERLKLAAGFLLGGFTGLVTLGVRFLPVMPVQYFYGVGALMLLFALACFTWSRLQARKEELFP